MSERLSSQGRWTWFVVAIWLVDAILFGVSESWLASICSLIVAAFYAFLAIFARAAIRDAPPMSAGYARRATQMPDERAAIVAMWEAHQRLRELGWREASYCPKDGTVFDAIHAGSTGIFHCHYDGKWPDGYYWTEDGGDLWPGTPILFRSLPNPAAGEDQHG